MRTLYLVLAVIGFVIPYYFFISFLTIYGFDLQLFVQQLFTNQISTFFVLDLSIATLVLYFFVSGITPFGNWVLVEVCCFLSAYWTFFRLAALPILPGTETELNQKAINTQGNDWK
jgi:hypothetical protein